MTHLELQQAWAELKQARESVAWWQGVAEAKQEERDRFRQALTRLACYAATARDGNTKEWMEALAAHLNEAAETLHEPTHFKWHYRIQTGECWITAEKIP